MANVKALFNSKETLNAYEGLVLIWPCVDKISGQLLTLIPDEQKKSISHVIQEAISAYHQSYPFYMTDWERLSVYLIVTINFIAKTLAGKKTFHQIVSSCTAIPRRMTPTFIEDTARKLSMELPYA